MVQIFINWHVPYRGVSAARVMGISRNKLYKKMRDLGPHVPR